MQLATSRRSLAKLLGVSPRQIVVLEGAQPKREVVLKTFEIVAGHEVRRMGRDTRQKE